MQDLRDVVKQRMAALGWSAYNLAETAHATHGVARTAVYEWLAGKRDILGTAFQGVADVLGLRLAVDRRRKPKTSRVKKGRRVHR